MSAKALKDLGTITDLLGPGVWLQVDGVHLERCFGASDPTTAATEFAEEKGCIFLPDEHGRAGRFGRANFKTSRE